MSQLNLQIVSDVHTEFHKSDQGRKILQKISKTSKDVDILLVAGDLSTIHGLRYAFSILCDNFEDVVYVTGNHEYYNSSKEKTHELINECCDKHPNLHWLNNKIKTIKGQRFIGTTLWFPDHPDARGHINWMTDFKVISNFEDWIWDEFNKNKSFLDVNMREGDVLLTHHLTSAKSIDKIFFGQVTNCYFLGDITDIIYKCNPKLSVFGHTHCKFDYMLYNTRVISNPVGYPQEGIPFSNKIISI